jgi:hypothetical protein
VLVNVIREREQPALFRFRLDLHLLDLSIRDGHRSDAAEKLKGIYVGGR